MNARASLPILAALAMLATFGGCASTLDVGYPEAAANRTLLGAVAPRRVALGPVTDRRMDRTRIGARPTNGEALETTRPVADVVRDALVVEFSRNGHSVVADDGDIRLLADVEEFWLDTSAGNSSVQYVGRVAIALAVADGRSGDTLLVRRYIGIRRLQAEADNRNAWREAMDTALARTMRDIATDPEVAATFARHANGR
jgi:uncharacterized lipoprotein YajG